ncbi:MAG: ABC transporter permease [Phycisphaerales bacterium]|nr:ABC transporter permease [Phycisphaerales bacterium]
MSSSSPRDHRSGTLVRTAVVAWREFKHTALTKAFFFGAVVVPALMLGVVLLIPSLISGRAAPIIGTVTVFCSDPAVVESAQKSVNERGSDVLMGSRSARGVIEQMAMDASEPSGIDVTIVAAAASDSIDALKERVRAGELIAVVSITDEALHPPVPAAGADSPEESFFDMFVASSTSPKHTALLQRAFCDAIVNVRVLATGADFEQLSALLRRPVAITSRLTPEGEEATENTERRFLIPMGFMMLVWMAVFSSANQLLTTTIEEKSSKVMEVLLAAASPMEILTGKILGQAGVAAVLLVMYGGLGMAGLIAATMADLVTPGTLLLLGCWAVMAYFMIGALMAAIGSAVSDLREAQSLVGPAMIILMIPLMLWLPITENPNGLFSTVCSFVPLLTPFVMILRTAGAIEPVPTWQIAAALLWGAFTTLAMMWMAARIFRVGVLMQGKPPSPLELLRWIRER